jgi:REP element-mobilizing transposase RayT
MNRRGARQPAFRGEGGYQSFLDTVADAHRQWRIEVIGFSLMRNHYHLGLRTPKAESLPGHTPHRWSLHPAFQSLRFSLNSDSDFVPFLPLA